MQERHINREKYFQEQSATIRNHVFPFLNQMITVDENTSILEIGCGEGGNLKPFLDLGCKRILGVDMSEDKINNAKLFFANDPNKANIEFITSDIYDVDNIGKFDIIMTRDVLEHIHGQERFMEYVKRFLKPGGKFFLGFPPWYNPFGGHQQMCESKVLSKLPFFHIFPKPIYGLILKTFGETDPKIEALMEIKDTGITIERFEKILKRTGYKKDKVLYYFINPNYEAKFGLKPREQIGFISSLPYLRNFLITTSYYLVSPINNN
ncbi:MAG: class I SAM-dependent methyltransferase [Bacteroidetes bacterium]|nr:class I SAM-dependent methyltransferase [Bacteroidota bacterium]